MSNGARDRVRKAFGEWSSTQNGPPLYARLAERVARSDEILDLYTHVPVHKQRPVLLFAAVHYLLLKGSDHPLARIYETPDAPGALDEAGERFHSFCLEHFDETVEIMQTRTVQTNEVNRCSALVPATMMIARETQRPLALVEIGASAGLNLLFDRFTTTMQEGR